VHGTWKTQVEWVIFNLHNGVAFQYSVGWVSKWWNSTDQQESLGKNLDRDDNGLIVFMGEP